MTRPESWWQYACPQRLHDMGAGIKVDTLLNSKEPKRFRSLQNTITIIVPKRGKTTPHEFQPILKYLAFVLICFAVSKHIMATRVAIHLVDAAPKSLFPFFLMYNLCVAVDSFLYVYRCVFTHTRVKIWYIQMLDVFYCIIYIYIYIHTYIYIYTYTYIYIYIYIESISISISISIYLSIYLSLSLSLCLYFVWIEHILYPHLRSLPHLPSPQVPWCRLKASPRSKTRSWKPSNTIQMQGNM